MQEEPTCLCKSWYKINQVLVSGSGSSQASSDTLNQRKLFKFSDGRAKQLMVLHYPPKRGKKRKRKRKSKRNFIHPMFGKYELPLARGAWKENQAKINIKQYETLLSLLL